MSTARKHDLHIQQTPHCNLPRFLILKAALNAGRCPSLSVSASTPSQSKIKACGMWCVSASPPDAAASKTLPVVLRDALGEDVDAILGTHVGTTKELDPLTCSASVATTVRHAWDGRIFLVPTAEYCYAIAHQTTRRTSLATKRTCFCFSMGFLPGRGSDPWY